MWLNQFVKSADKEAHQRAFDPHAAMGLIPPGVPGAASYGIGQASVPRKKASRRALGPDHTASVARGEALVGFSGAIVGLLGVLLPHPPSFDEFPLIAIQALTCGFAVFLYLRADRVARWVVSAMPAGGGVFTS